MLKTNEATDTDLKVIERLQQSGWKLGAIFHGNHFVVVAKEKFRFIRI